MAIISAASPDGTESSAHDKVRLPPISSRIPTTAASAICRAEYQILRPVAAHTTSITTPAIENRTAHISAGGMLCTAILMARYVEPQNRYTSPKARMTDHRLGRCVLVMTNGEDEKTIKIPPLGNSVTRNPLDTIIMLRI